MVNIKSFGPSTVLGEGPHWDYNEQVLYYVDIYDAKFFKYNPKNGEVNSVKIGGKIVSFIIPIEGEKDKFVISVDRSLAILTWDGTGRNPVKVEYIATVDKEEDKAKYSVLNDGKVDPAGRLWAGTRSEADPKTLRFLKPKVGSLFSFSNGQDPVRHLTDITCSNGLAWSSDRKKMYYVDSADPKIYVFDFDEVTGEISNRQIAFDFEATKTKGSPDGMTIDAEDKLWVACFGGSQVIRVDPVNGTVISKIEIPAKQVTSVTFGGPNLDELYVTTGSIRLSEEEKKQNVLHGKTFQITDIGVKGTKNLYAKL